VSPPNTGAGPFGVRREPLVEVQHRLNQRIEALVAVVLLRERQPRSMLKAQPDAELLESQPEALA
jgi:hypothetical protein